MIRWSISTKLKTVFSSLIVVLVLVGLSGYSGMVVFHDRLEEVGNVRLPAMDFLIEADRDLQQLLVAERSLLLVDPSTPGFQGFLEEHQQNLEQSDERWRSYTELADTDQERMLFDAYNRARQNWMPLTRRITTELATANETRRLELLQLSLNEGKAAFEAMRDVIDQLTNISLEHAHRAQAEAETAYGRSSVFLILLLIIGIGGSIVISFLLTRNLVQPIHLITEGAKKFSVGDVEMDGMDLQLMEKTNARTDELGETSRAFSTLVDYMREKAHVADQISQGRLDFNISIASESDMLGKGMAMMKKTLDDLNDAMQNMYDQQKAGDIEYFIDSSKFNGAFSQVTEGYNKAVQLHIDAILLFLNLIAKYADGDFSEKLKPMPGKQKIANEVMDKLRDNLLKVTADIKGLINGAVKGELSARADAARHSGEFAEIMRGINQLLDAIIQPINESAQVLARMAEGDLRSRVEGNFQGDHAKIKHSLNTTVDSLNHTLAQVRISVEQVHNGAEQVSSASQSLSQGATEQASSLEEVSSAMTEIGTQTQHNADNATQAFKLTDTAREAVFVGNNRMEDMLGAMGEITSKSNEVRKIIKVIDEIAFQTNLLALNAAVEAARAGVHGKGFAVVAEEVRNLAQRSAVAARETTNLIESNLASVNTGSEIAEQTASALGEIVEGISKVAALVKDIADASSDQAAGVGQINSSLGQIELVTQSNTSNAEESAAASEELSSQAEHLNDLVSQFRLNMSKDDRMVPGSRMVSSAPKKETKRLGGSSEGSESEEFQVKPDEVINLDDDDFASF